MRAEVHKGMSSNDESGMNDDSIDDDSIEVGTFNFQA